MNLAYFRKSTFSLEQTVENLKKSAQENNWKVLSEVEISEGRGKLILICKPEWVKAVVEENHEMLAFLPCGITVLKKDEDILIGTGQLTVLKAFVKSKSLETMVNQAEKLIKDLIHTTAGVKELTPSHVKLYSTMTCPYCKMEKEWLESNGVKHEVIYVDQNQKEAEKMVERTGQMGVPVTEIQYEEGEPEFVVGFDKGRLSAILGVTL